MSSNPLTGWNRKKLRYTLSVFFMALAIPTAILIYQAWDQLKWESFHRHRQMAEELSIRIDRNIMELVNGEEARPFTDYSFLNVVGNPSANFIQRSPLSEYPVSENVPGLIGYFQVDPQGVLSTPLLPLEPGLSPAYGITEEELEQRRSLVERIQEILNENRLVEHRLPPAMNEQDELSQLVAEESADLYRLGTVAAEGEDYSDTDAGMADSESGPMEVPAQAAFDELGKDSRRDSVAKRVVDNSNYAEALNLSESRMQAPPPEDSVMKPSAPDLRSKRREQNVLPEKITTTRQAVTTEETNKEEIRISIFESEVDPFELSLLDSGHFVMFRKVWRNGQRYIQGALIDSRPFIKKLIEASFSGTALSRMSDLTVFHQGNIFSVFHGQAGVDYLSSPQDMISSLLFQSSLSSPLNDLVLVFTVNNLPLGSGGTIIIWIAAILGLIMISGFFLMYRLGLGQINLTHQQQDFVSAVSHELKTPLTSIRMYGEMLREGWAEEEKKKIYYEYIYEESERLSRLISNVLQLARMTRNDLQVDLRPVPVNVLIDGIRSKVSSQIERAGFKLELECEGKVLDSVIEVDMDCFSQIMINLVDNAIKFSKQAKLRKIDIKCASQLGHNITFTVRDYGPGVARGHMKKIFRLFYRSESELTRETVGTGIGLALVKQLVTRMNGQVDVVNCDPGAEFRVSFLRTSLQ